MALAHRDGRRQVFPTRPRQVYDITGAGDMVMSVLGMALAAGADYEPAIRLANVAGGLEVEKIGVATVTRDEILRDLLHEGGLVSGQQKAAAAQRCSAWSSTAVAGSASASPSPTAASMCCTPATCSICRRPAQADLLVVGLNSDASVRQLKGRPAGQSARGPRGRCWRA